MLDWGSWDSGALMESWSSTVSRPTPRAVRLSEGLGGLAGQESGQADLFNAFWMQSSMVRRANPAGCGVGAMERAQRCRT